MALIKCPHCGKPISDKAKTCIHCNSYISNDTELNNHISEEILESKIESKRTETERTKKNSKVIVIVLSVILTVIVIGLIIGVVNAKQKAVAYQHIAGTYGIAEWDDLEGNKNISLFAHMSINDEEPNYYDCIIRPDGTISFPYYDGVIDVYEDGLLIENSNERLSSEGFQYEIVVENDGSWDDISGSIYLMVKDDILVLYMDIWNEFDDEYDETLIGFKKDFRLTVQETPGISRDEFYKWEQPYSKFDADILCRCIECNDQFACNVYRKDNQECYLCLDCD